MTARNFLGICVLFLLSLGESLSLKPPARAMMHPPPKQLLGVAPNLFALRGGEQQAEQSTPPKTALDLSCLTGALAALGKFYSSSLESSPVLTKSVTAGVLFAISDQMAQMLEMQRNKKPVSLAATNKKRSLFSGLVGLLYFGPMADLWYGWIFRTFPGKSMLSILQKAALGQFFFAPPLFCVFFAAALLQNGEFTLGNWVRKIKQDLVKGWLGGLGFWPIANYISYGYIPQKYIPLFVNLMGLVFNIYVSLIANLKQKQPGNA